MTNKSRTFLPIAARLRQGIPVVFYGDGQGGFRSTFHDQQAAEAVEILVEALETCRGAMKGIGLENGWIAETATTALEKVRAMK